MDYELSVPLGEGKKTGVVFRAWASEPVLGEGRFAWIWSRDVK